MSEHGPHADPNDPFQRNVAVTLAIFSVGLAFVNMLTNQSRTQSILRSNEATNTWSYFQSKSTKQTVRTSQLEITQALPTPPAEQITKLTAEIQRYDAEKKEIQDKADQLAAQSKDAEHKEHYYEYSAVGIELGIVIAGVALLLHKKVVFYFAVAAAVAGALGCAYTSFLLKGHSGEAHATAEAAPPAAGHGH